jgi:peptidoglycan/LPS O-acetylase OafA/YrhL
MNLHPLTSLRFVAAMMIVIHHAHNYFSWPWISYAPSTLVHGVSFFFVLSGFILTHVYTSKPFPGYGRFLQARFARLWPVHVFAIVMLVMYIQPDSITFDGPGIFDKRVQLLFNLSLTHAIFPFWSFPFSWNAVSWSISTEVFFYLVFPILLIDIRKSWQIKLIASIMLMCAVYLVMDYFNFPLNAGLNEVSIASVLYTNPLVRGFEFCLGMAAWVVWDQCIRMKSLSYWQWTAIELVVMIAVSVWLKWWFYFIQPLIKVTFLEAIYGNAGSCWIFAILIIVFASGRGLVGKLLSTKLTIFLGEISFSIYMIHQILYKFFAGLLPKESTSTAMYFAALIFIATGTFLIIEKPARRYLMNISSYIKNDR